MKVVILGGGPAGCAAAWYLKQKGINDIKIVEKDGADNLGGCSRTNIYQKIPYEFGPQILYTDEDDIKRLFEKYVKNKKPPTEDGEYHPKVFIDTDINNPHEFPITVSNVLKQKDPAKVIYELYKLNLDKPDYSNFENYMISRVGNELYQTYVKNYNIKQWKIDPKEMDAEWAKLRTLTLREKNDMFQGRWQGHPGDYTPLWRNLVKGCAIISGTASIDEDYSRVFVDGDEIKADLFVSTLPLSNKLDYIHTYKVFVGINEPEYIMPSYANSFPNNYSFTRIIEYKQQYHVDSGHALISFAFQWNENNLISERECMHEAEEFVVKVLKRKCDDIWVQKRDYTYPVHNHKNEKLLKSLFKKIADSNIVPIGRCGVHAYVSKDICFRMARILSENIELVASKGIGKEEILNKMREKLR